MNHYPITSRSPRAAALIAPLACRLRRAAPSARHYTEIPKLTRLRNGGSYAEIHQNYAMGNLLMEGKHSARALTGYYSSQLGPLARPGPEAAVEMFCESLCPNIRQVCGGHKGITQYGDRCAFPEKLRL